MMTHPEPQFKASVGSETTLEEMWRSDSRIARSTNAFESAQQRLKQQLEKLGSTKLYD